MTMPQPTLGTTVMPLTGISASVHEFAGISWHILLPYTLLGGSLIIYSHTRLVRGEQVLSQQKTPKSRTKRPSKTQAYWLPQFSYPFRLIKLLFVD